MPISESDLPGVGKKFEIDLPDDRVLVVVIHNTGRRDVFVKPDADADSERLFELPDQLARRVGSILEGAFFQPIETDDAEMTLGEDTLIEWVDVPAGSPLDGESIGDLLADERIGVAIVAVERNGDVIPASMPQKNLNAGDTVVVVGSRDDLLDFESLLEETG